MNMAAQIIPLMCVTGCVLLSATAQVNCPSDWTPSDQSGTCVKLYTDSLEWSDAQTACQAVGGDLVVIPSSAMNEFISDTFAATGNAWIGLYEIVDASSETHVWVDGTEATGGYTNWEGGITPNDDGIAECAAFVFSSGEWLETYCYNYYSYICEILPVGTTRRHTASPSPSTSPSISTSPSPSPSPSLFDTLSSSTIKTTTTKTTSTTTIPKETAVASQTTTKPYRDFNNNDTILTPKGLGVGAITAVVFSCLVVIGASATFGWWLLRNRVFIRPDGSKDTWDLTSTEGGTGMIELG